MPMSFSGLAQPISGAIPLPVRFPAVLSLCRALYFLFLGPFQLSLLTFSCQRANLFCWGCSTCLLFRHVTFFNGRGFGCHENNSASARIIFSIGLFPIFLDSNCCRRSFRREGAARSAPTLESTCQKQKWHR
ncbi:hypothetical protein GALMADRAFT_573664 [Galerina marginata CBS 339.88]|uniref:Uncharacterized protein n=1 Tax=Galerina marginata (strain CBS 339.88) TaxID=685588 RepID=A0A067SW09_GALM3|nr:hypothetical protein GALMADRAFT_573664 [Galerina marginata CBS 339.88]